MGTGCGNILPRVTLRWTSIPTKGGVVHCSTQLLHATKTVLSSVHVVHLGLNVTLPYPGNQVNLIENIMFCYMGLSLKLWRR